MREWFTREEIEERKKNQQRIGKRIYLQKYESLVQNEFTNTFERKAYKKTVCKL